MSLLVKVGTYTGTGSDPQTISGVGFQPKAMILPGNVGAALISAAMWKTDGMTTGATGLTMNLGNNTAQNTGEIDSFTSDGFLVRGEKNLAGTTYYYVCWGGTGCITGTYTGNLTARTITTTGIFPAWAVVVAAGGAAFHKCTATGNAVDLCQRFSSNADLTNRITSLIQDGFTVSNNNNINNTGVTYYYMALGGDNIASAQYTGDGTSPSVHKDLPFIPIAMYIKGASSVTQTVVRSTETGNNTSRFGANQAPISGAIASFQFRGYTFGAAATVNTNAATYNYIAFGRTGGDGGFF